MCFKKIKVISLLITSFIPKITWSFVPFYNAQVWFPVSLDETLSQASSATSASASGVYEIPARLRTLHNLVIQYASQVGFLL